MDLGAIDTRRKVDGDLLTNCLPAQRLPVHRHLLDADRGILAGSFSINLIFEEGQQLRSAPFHPRL
jgi:hypothetical protein